MRDTLLTLSLLAAPLAAHAQQPAAEPTTLRLVAEAQARVAPDYAVIQAGVVTEAANAAQAMNANARQISQTIRAIRQAGVNERDVQTANISLLPQYSYEDSRPPQLTGYRAENTVSVTVRDLKNLGKIIDAVTVAGANQIQGVRFEASQPREAINAARLEAVRDARSRAELYAQAMGMRVVRVALVEEGGAASDPQPLARFASAEAASTPIEPGELLFPMVITATFEMR